jgi:hypothetical protein
MTPPSPLAVLLQAEKLEQAQAELNDDAAALMEDVELPLSLKAGGELSGYLVQVSPPSAGKRPTIALVLLRVRAPNGRLASPCPPTR